MHKIFIKRSHFLIIVSILVIVFFVGFFKAKDSKLEYKNIAVAKCVALSAEIRINEKTKECFDKLGYEDFLYLYKNEEYMKLYEDVQSYYDKRTDAQKAEDAKKTEDYVNEVIKNLQNNPDAYKK